MQRGKAGIGRQRAPSPRLVLLLSTALGYHKRRHRHGHACSQLIPTRAIHWRIEQCTMSTVGSAAARVDSYLTAESAMAEGRRRTPYRTETHETAPRTGAGPAHQLSSALTAMVFGAGDHGDGLDPRANSTAAPRSGRVPRSTRRAATWL